MEPEKISPYALPHVFWYIRPINPPLLSTYDTQLSDIKHSQGRLLEMIPPKIDRHEAFAYLEYERPYIRLWDNPLEAKQAARKAEEKLGGKWQHILICHLFLKHVIHHPLHEHTDEHMGQYLVLEECLRPGWVEPVEEVAVKKPEASKSAEGASDKGEKLIEVESDGAPPDSPKSMLTFRL